MERIRFTLDAEDWHGLISERLWGEAVPGGDGECLFRIMNSPFFYTKISYMDVVSANTDRDGDLAFRQVVEKSGHSTVVVLVPIESKEFFHADSWPTAEALGCSYESGEIGLAFGLAEMLSIDVPPTVDRPSLRNWLLAGERASLFLYQESDIRWL